MISAAQLLMIEEAAAAAEGRREMRCQLAMADIYKAAGLLPPGLEIPNGDRNWAKSQGRSLIKDWLEQSPFFVLVPPPAQPGDLLCFRLGHTPHHVAIQLAGGRMVHVFSEHGVRIAPAIPTPWAKRIDSIWRLA
ncbi:MAG: NlpC/P60 family protein [Moraxellaceae bacterium]|nr:NlpC/P60 family protein [Moraxellaceae bacterium]